MTSGLVRNFKSTTVWKAFLLNSIVASFTIVISLVVKTQIDVLIEEKYKEDELPSSTWQSVLATVAVAFSSAFFTYTLMYALFGFGGGMLVNDPPSPHKKKVNK